MLAPFMLTAKGRQDDERQIAGAIT